MGKFTMNVLLLSWLVACAVAAPEGFPQVNEIVPEDNFSEAADSALEMIQAQKPGSRVKCPGWYTKVYKTNTCYSKNPAAGYYYISPEGWQPNICEIKTYRANRANHPKYNNNQNCVFYKENGLCKPAKHKWHGMKGLRVGGGKKGGKNCPIRTNTNPNTCSTYYKNKRWKWHQATMRWDERTSRYGCEWTCTGRSAFKTQGVMRDTSGSSMSGKYNAPIITRKIFANKCAFYKKYYHVKCTGLLGTDCWYPGSSCERSSEVKKNCARTCTGKGKDKWSSETYRRLMCKPDRRLSKKERNDKTKVERHTKKAAAKKAAAEAASKKAKELKKKGVAERARKAAAKAAEKKRKAKAAEKKVKADKEKDSKARVKNSCTCNGKELQITPAFILDAFTTTASTTTLLQEEVKADKEKDSKVERHTKKAAAKKAAAEAIPCPRTNWQRSFVIRKIFANKCAFYKKYYQDTDSWYPGSSCERSSEVKKNCARTCTGKGKDKWSSETYRRLMCTPSAKVERHTKKAAAKKAAAEAASKKAKELKKKDVAERARKAAGGSAHIRKGRIVNGGCDCTAAGLRSKGSRCRCAVNSSSGGSAHISKDLTGKHCLYKSGQFTKWCSVNGSCSTKPLHGKIHYIKMGKDCLPFCNPATKDHRLKKWKRCAPLPAGVKMANTKG